MTAKQSPQEKETKKAARAARKAEAQSSTPAPPEPTPEPPTEEESSTPPEAAQEPTQAQDETVEPSEPPAAPEADPEPAEKPKRGRPRKPKPCLDPLKVAVGSVVRYWLPLAGANAKLIDATVSKCDPNPEKGRPAVLELHYESQAGVQCREAVQYVGHRPTKKGQSGAWLQARTGRWMEFPEPFNPDAATE